MSRSTFFQSYRDVFLGLSSTCQKDVDLDVKPQSNKTELLGIWIKGHVYVKVIGPTCRAHESQYINVPAYIQNLVKNDPVVSEKNRF